MAPGPEKVNSDYLFTNLIRIILKISFKKVSSETLIEFNNLVSL